jgi:hypothetical protein
MGKFLEISPDLHPGRGQQRIYPGVGSNNRPGRPGLKKNNAEALSQGRILVVCGSILAWQRHKENERNIGKALGKLLSLLHRTRNPVQLP